MTIGGWITFFVLFASIVIIALLIGVCSESNKTKVLVGVLAFFLSLLLLIGMLWYFNNTATGIRAMTDEKSNLKNGLERTITVYTADGNVIAQYHGKIDIEGNDGGYVLFDFDGRRYTYYNCFVESIADID